MKSRKSLFGQINNVKLNIMLCVINTKMSVRNADLKLKIVSFKCIHGFTDYLKNFKMAGKILAIEKPIPKNYTFIHCSEK